MTLGSSLMDLLAMYGVTFFLRDSEMFHPIRKRLVAVDFFRRLLSCAYCTGFYSGAFVFVVSHPLPSPLGDIASYLSGLVVFSFAGMAFSGVADALALRLESSV